MAALFNVYQRQQHPYQIVPGSIYPFWVSASLFATLFFSVCVFHDLFNIYYLTGRQLIAPSLVFFVSGILLWGHFIFQESYSFHTFAVQRNLRVGMLWFIVSEVCFFLTFFASFFFISLEPRVSIGCIWPPVGIEPVSMWNLSFFNTILLLSSGIFLLWAHAALLAGDWNGVYSGVLGVLLLSVLFLSLQAFEYYILTFSINDSVYGAFFFLMTGFHGLHVLFGTLLFVYFFIDHCKSKSFQDQYVFFECAAWYWHFVDVVWFFVYLNFYVWGSWGI